MKKGFTLIEFLVVISIIGILSGISFSAMKSGGKSLALSRSTHSLATQIREVQEMAISTKKYQGSVPPGGYGIYFYTNEFPISDEGAQYNIACVYRDLNNNETYDDGEIIKSLTLEKGTRIKLVRGAGDTGAGNIRQNYSANFKPPFPKISFKKWGPGLIQEFNDDFLIIISLEQDLNKTRTIRINKAGLISIE